MSLPNRVDPFGNLFADASRGLLFGNRGGRFHRDDRTLGARRWVSRRWICCRLDFKGRHRNVWGAGYTELFFLDEPTALAAGHRPCFECRRADAQAFAAAFARDAFRARGRDRSRTPRRAARWACQASPSMRDRRLARRQHDHLAGGAWPRLCGSWPCAAAMGVHRVHRRASASAQSHGRRSDAAWHLGGAVGRLSAPLAPERRRAIALTNKKPYRLEWPRKLPSVFHQPATLFAQRRAGSGTCPSEQQTRSADRERIDSTQLSALSRAAP